MGLFAEFPSWPNMLMVRAVLPISSRHTTAEAIVIANRLLASP
ncbi:hypothetical protein [Inquilinus sp. OTU3971]